MEILSLREASVQEAGRLLEIEQAAFEPYRTILDPQSGVFRETPDVIRQKMTTGRFLVACVGEQIVGLVFYQHNDEHTYLGRLSVLPGWQGRGIARMLIEAVEQRARQFGRPVVQLAVRLALPQLIAMYRRHGYLIIAEHCHPGYSYTTFVTMEKRLTT